MRREVINHVTSKAFYGNCDDQRGLYVQTSRWLPRGWLGPKALTLSWPGSALEIELPSYPSTSSPVTQLHFNLDFKSCLRLRISTSSVLPAFSRHKLRLSTWTSQEVTRSKTSISICYTIRECVGVLYIYHLLICTDHSSWFAYISPTESCLLEDVLITPVSHLPTEPVT